MSFRQQYGGQLCGHQLGQRYSASNMYYTLMATNQEQQRCPHASNVDDNLVAISQDRDALPQAMCRIAWWSSTRQEMSSRQQCVRQPDGHQLGKKMSSRQQCVCQPGGNNLGKRCHPAKSVYDSLVSIIYERVVLPPAMCRIAWWPSTGKQMSSRQQCVRQPGGHELGQRCSPASNVYDILVAINQNRDVLPAAMCTIAWWPPTRIEMSSRQ